MALTVQYGRRTITVIPDGSTDFILTTAQSPILELNTVVGTFTVGENVTQASSSAAGVVASWSSPVLKLVSVTGTFDATNVVTGGSSSAHGIPTVVKYAFPNGIRLTKMSFLPSQANDVVMIQENTVTGPTIWKAKDTTGGGTHMAVSGRSYRRNLVIDASSQTLGGTAGNARYVFEYD